MRESLCLPLEMFAIKVTVVMDPACDMRVTVKCHKAFTGLSWDGVECQKIYG